MSPNRLLFSFAQRYPKLVFLTVLLGFSGALFNGVSTTLIAPIVLDLLGQEVNLAGAPPIIQAMLTPFDDISENYRILVMVSAIILAIALKNLATYASSLVSGVLSRSLTRDLREAGLWLALEVDLDFYSRMRVGDLINRLGGEVNRTASAIRIIIQMFVTVITILVFVGLLLSISWQLTIASTVLLTLVALVNQYAIGRSKSFGTRLSEISKAYSVSVLEALSGIRLVKATGNEDREFERIKSLIRDREHAEFQSQANFAAIGPISEVTGIVVLIVIVVLGRLFFASELESLSAVLLTYLLVLFRLLPIISQLNNSRSQLANSAASVEVVNDFLRRDDKPFMGRGGPVVYQGIKEGIHFNHLSFAYPGQQDFVLKDIDLYLPRGTTLALVGASGAGKSTLVDLLPRFYDPTEGSIMIDGRDLREFELKSVRRAMGIVSQETFLFNDSVRNNIAYSRINATDEEVIEAAKRANAYEFIVQLPQGFETQIGDRGVLLSGGQRQRLAIARALLQDPEILILDEATSALDTVSERLVQAAIDELSRERTALVIAHRLSTVQKAHQIAVLDKGRVVEVGTHEELLKRGGYYTRLYTMQFSDKGEETMRENRRESLAKFSYEIRTLLNSTLGSLRLLVDGVVDDSEEQIELAEEAYHSAAKLLQSLELVEGERTKIKDEIKS